MRLDGFGLLVENMGEMIRFYRDVLGFEIKEEEDSSNVYLVKDGTLFLLYGRKDFEDMTSRKYEYIKGLNGHFMMHEFMGKEGYALDITEKRLHHEIYLSDARKVAPRNCEL